MLIDASTAKADSLLGTMMYPNAHTAVNKLEPDLSKFLTKFSGNLKIIAIMKGLPSESIYCAKGKKFNFDNESFCLTLSSVNQPCI